MADFPSTPFSNLTLTSNVPTLITRSLNGREERAQIATQFWSFSASFSNLTDTQRRQLLGFIMSKRGAYSSFTIELPDTLDDSSGAYTGTITTTTATAGALSFTATVASNNTLILRSGDMIKFANHDKVYMVTADATSTGAGGLTVSLFPAIRTTSNTVVVTHKTVPITVRFGSQEYSFQMAQELFGSFDLDFIEVI